MQEPMFWGLVFGFGVYSVVGVTTFFLAHFLLGLAFEGENVQIIAALLAVAGMLNTTVLLKKVEE